MKVLLFLYKGKVYHSLHASAITFAPCFPLPSTTTSLYTAFGDNNRHYDNSLIVSKSSSYSAKS
ncbi:hypothetical protein KsCSTR_48120 [Candidatus Kuenenia stuttgartiensis]|uniref:Uncharacterized protein n=1 Tax=Kuenenia stuttgartiensis TaxID=174633 RepID=Q1PVS4_KUEST|nr:hypothetical protein KsCSTR_48120 [Candidatus Kuenenia stuttgartiensis]CAJ71329.1 unknown protein [Candidatus Kuenenia stuttgartiensis]